MHGAAFALAVVVVAALAWLALCWWRDPFGLVRLEFARQRIAARLWRRGIEAGGHRWIMAGSDAAPDDAPLLLMLHGFTGSKENWYPLAARLHGRCRVRIPDLPGWGESQRIDGADYGFVAQAQRVRALIDALAPRQPLVLLGHSMGGGIAAIVAAREPRRVAKVVLLDAAGVRFDDNPFGQAVLDGENPFAVHDRASLDRYLDTVFHRDAARPWIPWPASAALIARRRADAAFEQAVLDGIGRGPGQFAPAEAAAEIRQPALLLWGREDAVIDPSALALFAAKMPQARTLLVDDCGHMSLLEQPDVVAAAIIALLEDRIEDNGGSRCATDG